MSGSRARCAGVGTLSAWTLALALVLPLALLGTAPAAAAATGSALGQVVVTHVGPGYAVTSEGPLDPSSFAAHAPEPSATVGALSTLSRSVATYQRTWPAVGGADQVLDLLLRFPDRTRARAFSETAFHEPTSSGIVDSAPVASVPGARRVTYITAANENGVGEAITMRSEVDVDLLVFFSAASGATPPIAPALVEEVARAQYAALAQAPGATAAPSPHHDAKRISAGTVGLAVAVVAVLALAVATPALLRRRHEATVADTHQRRSEWRRRLQREPRH